MSAKPAFQYVKANNCSQKGIWTVKIKRTKLYSRLKNSKIDFDFFGRLIDSGDLLLSSVVRHQLTYTGLIFTKDGMWQL